MKRGKLVDSYVDLIITPREQQSIPVLISSVFAQLHFQLVTRAKGDVGVSFPHADKKSLGDTLRLHGQAVVLNELLAGERLRRMKDYYRSPTVANIPAEHSWRRVARFQKGMTAAKARRLVARGSITEERAQALYDETAARVDLPFLQLQSASTGGRYKLFVAQTEYEGSTASVSFNSYGMGGCVPWF